MTTGEPRKFGQLVRSSVNFPRPSDETIARVESAWNGALERAFTEALAQHPAGTDEPQAEVDPHEWDLPEVTTEQAAALFDVSPDLIAKWKHRRQLVPVGMLLGRGRGGQAPVYRTSEVAELASAYHRRRAARAARIAARATPGPP